MRISTILPVLLASTLQAQVNTEWMRRDEGSEGTHARMTLGTTVEQGNSDVLDIVASGRVDGRFRWIYSFLVGSYRRSLSRGDAFRNNAFIHLRVALPLDTTGFLRAELFGQKQFDDFLQLSDRNLVGSGARIRLVDVPIDSVALLVHLGIGGMFESESTTEPVTTRTDLVRSTNYLTLSLRTTPLTTLLATAYYQPSIVRLHDFRLLVDGSMTVQMSTLLSIFVAVNYRFDNEPHADLKKYDVKITNGLSVDF